MHTSPALREIGAKSSSGHAAEADFERLYRDYHARIYNLTARIVGNREDASDVTQEVFLRAYSHPIDTSDGRSAEPWLYRIAVNASYDHLRRLAARPTAPLDSVPELAANGDGFADAETTRLVESCLADLTPRYRTALVLKDLHGLSNAEIAEVMGLHGGAARVLLHRARTAFRRAFQSATPSKAGGITTLGLAAFLPELPVPAILQAPPWAHLAPVASAPAPSFHPAPPTAGGEQLVLSAGPPAAAIPAAVAPVAPTGLIAGLGSVAGIKTAVAVVAAVVVTGGGAVIGHSVEPAGPQATMAHKQTAATAAATTDPLGDSRTRREMIRARLGLTGLATAIGGATGGTGGVRAGAGSGDGQRQGGSEAGGSGTGGTGSGAGGGTAAGTGGGTAAGGTGTGSTGTGGTDAGGAGGTGIGGAGGTDAGGAGGTGTGGTGDVEDTSGTGTGPGGPPTTGGSDGGTGTGTGGGGG